MALAAGVDFVSLVDSFGVNSALHLQKADEASRPFDYPFSMILASNDC